ncbi:probable LRR receptor-like serine/threonine-protein kinase At1g05700 [Arachis ipaensis]|uniref:senescence-induced receptor-like serine/threonine-protein kinase n=1 Tax=Arachis hypogaea TaxID=3818 RepID=UPI000A2B1083|nr:probable LRR receptor-like serine/threonine-protein kinase At1g05700 [Arachis ipaensis]XP_025677943.1 probable LRR receptor-like serine/threonine-protein kinase At1g05700 [Arachis hypogaea]
MMANSLHSLFLLLGILSFLAPVLGQDQSEFTSIDCGLPENSNYTEKSTGINYISDANFVDSGVSKTVSPQDKATHQQYFTYLRSFPNGTRNCYRINVTSATRYLIRTSFLYGNYDGLNKLPQFDIYLGVHFWDTVKFTNSSLSKNYEIIHTPSLDYIHICMVNKGTGTPFISVIEMRILNNATYTTKKPSTSLALFQRLDFGSITNLTYRYKDDPYDRIWEPYWDNKWTQLSSRLSNEDLIQHDFKPPAVVMETAATPRNVTASLDFNWEIDDETEHQYYFYLHFTELQKLGTNQTRSFNTTINDVPWDAALQLRYHEVHTRNTLTGPWLLTKRGHISLIRTQSSTLPPIINALEIYFAKDFSELETQRNDVEAVTNIKRAYRMNSRNWEGDPCAPIAYKWQGVECSSFDGFLRITSLNLSSSGLNGHIPADISKLTMLKSLDLSDNGLNGNIPSFLAQLQSLEYLNLANNNLTGSVSNELLQKQSDGQLSLSVGQNPNLCASTSCNQQTNDTRKKNNNATITVVASIAGILLLLVIVEAVIIFRLKKQYATTIIFGKRRNSMNGSQLESKQRQYSFNEVVKMTNNFDKILGRGGFGKVYHGFIEDIQVAVKMLSLSSVQGYQQFVAEVKLLMRVYHRNLTSLIGYCNEKTNIGLIYEYMANGNLDEHLSGKNNKEKSLNWEDRLRIALDAAQGLEYLHNGCKPPIIHRDVKCSNILLNEKFHAKLADIGLSKCFAADSDTHVSTIVAGTPGYLDPEYTTSNRLTEKSDVYSFGVVLLRIITGQPVIILREDMTDHISQRVNSMIVEGDITSIVDSRIQGDFDNGSAWRVVEIAMASVSPSSLERPYMSDIVRELKECLAAELGRKHNSCDLQNEDLVGHVSVNLISTDMTPLAR